MGETAGEAVAQAVRRLRTAHAWSLDELAARSGVSKGALVALEQGRGNPSLNTLIRISEALGVPLTQLVQTDEEPSVRIFEPRRQAVLWEGPEGGHGMLLAGSDPRPSVELWKWLLRPGESRESDAHTPGTREIVFVEEGRLTLVVDGRPHPIETGTAAVFAGDWPHSYANEGDADVRFVLAVMDP